MFTQRKKGLKFTDKRVRITTEVLQGIRLIKFYAWEAFYVQQIAILRTKEIKTIRISAYVLLFIEIGVKLTMSGQCSSVGRSSLIALMTFIPILASVLSFVRHSNTLHLNGY